MSSIGGLGLDKDEFIYVGTITTQYGIVHEYVVPDIVEYARSSAQSFSKQMEKITNEALQHMREDR